MNEKKFINIKTICLNCFVRNTFVLRAKAKGFMFHTFETADVNVKYRYVVRRQRNVINS